MVQEFIDQLIKDLDKIHQDSGIHISEMDDEVLKTISVVKGSEKPNKTQIMEIHLKLISTYLDRVLSDSNKFITEISRTLINTKKYKTGLNNLRREKEELQRNIKYEKEDFGKFYEPLTNSWNKTIDFWNELVDSESDLQKEAWLKFIRWIYLPVLVVVAAIYAAYIRLNALSPEPFGQIVWKFSLVAAALFFILRHIVKNFIFNTDDKVIESN